METATILSTMSDSFYGNLGKRFRMPLAWVELAPVCKLKELSNLYCEASSNLFDTAYTAMYKAVFK